MSPPTAPGVAAPPAAPTLLEDLARLLDEPATVAEFHQGFLRRLLAATGATAAALWVRDAQNAFDLAHHLNLPALDQIANGVACHAAILARVAIRARPAFIPAHSGPATRDGKVAAANLTDHGLLAAPLSIDGASAGVLELWLSPSQAERPPLTRLLAEVAALAAAHLHRSQWRSLKDQQQIWAEAEAFAREIHTSLDPLTVATLVANQGRALLGCDQLAVGLRDGRTLQVEAVSGAVTVDARAPVVMTQRILLDRVLTWGEALAYDGTRDEALPPAVAAALDAYLAVSPSRLLLAWPLPGDDKPQAILLAECFTASATQAQLTARLDVLAPHAAAALDNALAYRRATASLPARCRRWFVDWLDARSGRKAQLAVVAAVVIAALLTLVPASLRIEARQLLPRERQIVYAPLNGKVVELKTQHGDAVSKGQELLFVEDLEAQLKAEQLAIRAAFCEQRLAALNEQLSRATAADERNTLLKERIDQEYELRKAALERDLLLQESRNPRKTPLVAPLSGKLVTFDAREQLVGKTVKPGDPLVRIASVQGPWEVEVLIPATALAPIREELARAGSAGLDVDLLLASQPLKTYKGRLRRDGLGGETTVKDNASVLPARVELADPDLANVLATLPVGLDVRARIGCGSRAVGYVWFGDLLEFVYERLLF